MNPEKGGPLYDQKIAKKYDEFYQTSETGLFLRDFLPQHIANRKVLDVGCGTGWLLDYQKDIISPENYVGVDISFPMASKLREKHPEYPVVNGNVKSIRGTFDIGLGIFGPLSYMKPDEVEHLNNIIEDKIFLMGYNEAAYSKILSRYNKPVVRGTIVDNIKKIRILETKFPDIQAYDLTDYVVFTNFSNAEQIKIFNDAKIANDQLTKTA